LDLLVPLVYDELEELARAQRRRWQGSVSVHTGSLLNEAYIRLAAQESPEWSNRAHFMAVAAMAMRQILIGHARRRTAKKRGGGRTPVPFEELEAVISSPEPRLEARDEVLILLDQSLTRLAKERPRAAQIVECRFFAGMTIPETAEALGISPATVKRGWAMAQAWLYEAMRGPEED
jgi:RNA polymerase sigma factor (TIGR02999 family)